MAVTKEPFVFVMHGARAAMADGLLHIEEQVRALEQAVGENTGLAFDLAKTLVESACKSIITERGSTVDDGDDMSKVFKVASQCVPLLPASLASEAGARKSLAQTFSGLHTALQGVCELRNAFGFASHGSDGPRPVMESVQALLAAQAADTIIGFLYRVHRADLARPSRPRLEFGDHRAFNEWVDGENEPVRIFSLPGYRPSEVLFNVDQEAYRDLLANYKAEQGDAADGDGATEAR